MTTARYGHVSLGDPSTWATGAALGGVDAATGDSTVEMSVARGSSVVTEWGRRGATLIRLGSSLAGGDGGTDLVQLRHQASGLVSFDPND